MTKKHEELVEEIRLVWCKDCADGPSRYEYSPDLDDDACEGGIVTIKLCRERARKIIAHTLSAFHDRRLDEELGVVGRCRAGLGEFASMVTWAHGIWKEGLLTTEHETTTFIALRPLTGTGKEEE